VLLLTCLLGFGAEGAMAEPGHLASPLQSEVGINGASCSYSDVASALIAASDGDTIYVSDANDVTHHGLIGQIYNDVTIVAATNDCQTTSTTEAHLDGDGGSWTLRGGLVVIASNKTVTFTRIRMQNARAPLGGGIVQVESGGILVLDDSRVMSGTAGYEGGGVNVEAGGALVMKNDSIIYRNALSQTQGEGGGVKVYSGTLLMENSSVGHTGTGDFNTSTGTGGGVHLENSVLYMNDAHVWNNIAVEEGGGVWADDDSTIAMYGDSTIGGYTQSTRGNNADDGGGVYLDGDSELWMNDGSRLGFNSAVNNGGGVYATRASTVKMDDSTSVYSNAATFGGGAYLTGTNTMLNVYSGSVSIEGNRAIAPIFGNDVANGGGVLVTDEAKFYAQQARLVNNSADLLGGAVYVGPEGAADPVAVLLYGGTQVAGNTAGYGGGLYVAQDDTQVLLDDVRIRSNAAITTGGGIRMAGDSFLLIANDSVISNNFAYHGDGAGLAMNDGDVQISNSLFQANYAGSFTPVGNGGALNQSGGHLTMTNTSLVENTAYSGGGLYMVLASTALTNVQVISNVASNNGGGIGLDYSALTLGTAFGPDCSPSTLPAHTYCTELRGNEASGQGAGIYVGLGQSTARIADTAFLANRGLTTNNADGEALWVGNDAAVSVTNALFAGHRANGNTVVSVDRDATYFSENSTYAGNGDVPLFVDSQAAATLTLNIIWDNGLAADIQGSLTSQCNDTQSASLGGSGDISQDPQFINLRGPYRLGPNSPAIDTCAGLIGHDLDGKSRPFNAIGSGFSLFEYDMGAFEARRPVFVPLALRNF
jgi:hypothetical protein